MQLATLAVKSLTAIGTRCSIRHSLQTKPHPVDVAHRSVLIIISHHHQLRIVPAILLSKLNRSSSSAPLTIPSFFRPSDLPTAFLITTPESPPYPAITFPHITVHGMMQHWQSSPHQHGFGPGGLPTVRMVLPLPLELPETLEVVLGGMVFFRFGLR